MSVEDGPLIREVYSHECFTLQEIDGQLYFIDVQLKTVELAILPTKPATDVRPFKPKVV